MPVISAISALTLRATPRPNSSRASHFNQLCRTGPATIRRGLFCGGRSCKLAQVIPQRLRGTARQFLHITRDSGIFSRRGSYIKADEALTTKGGKPINIKKPPRSASERSTALIVRPVTCDKTFAMSCASKRLGAGQFINRVDRARAGQGGCCGGRNIFMRHIGHLRCSARQRERSRLLGLRVKAIVVVGCIGVSRTE